MCLFASRVGSGCKIRICHHKLKLDERNDGWTKKGVKIFKICNFPNITLAGLESAIVTKRHLIFMNAPLSVDPFQSSLFAGFGVAPTPKGTTLIQTLNKQINIQVVLKQIPFEV